MAFYKQVKIRSYEKGLYFRNGEFKAVLDAGTHRLVDPLLQVRIEIVSQRDPWLVHDRLEVSVR